MQQIDYDPSREQRTNDSYRLFHISDIKFVKLSAGVNLVPSEDWEKVVEFSSDVIDMLVDSKAVVIETVEPPIDPEVEPDPALTIPTTSIRKTRPTTLT